MNLKSHWDKIYSTRQQNEVSWYQPTPKVSLDFIHELNIPATFSFIIVGCGVSFLAEHLLSARFFFLSIVWRIGFNFKTPIFFQKMDK